MWPIKTILFFCGFTGACTFSLAYPVAGVVAYIFVYLVSPSEMWWGKPLEPLNIRYSLTAGVCMLLGMVVSPSRIPGARRFFDAWEMLLITFTIIVLASGFTCIGEFSNSVVLMDKCAKMALFMLCLTRMAASPRNMRIVLWTLMVGTAIVGWDAFNAPPDDFVRGRLNFVGGADFRDSSGLGVHMAAMIPLVGAVFMIARPWYWKIPVAFAGALTVNTVIQCRTRSAFMGLLGGACAAVVLAPRQRRTRIYTSLIIAGLCGLSLCDDGFWQRMGSLLTPSERANDVAIVTRQEIWKAGIHMFLDYPLGIGTGQFQMFIDRYTQWSLYDRFGYPRRAMHNTHLLCATELGILGLLAYLGLIALAFHKARRSLQMAWRSRDPHGMRIIAYACTISLVIYLVAASFTDRLYTESFWWSLTLPVCLEHALRSELAELEPALLAGEIEDLYAEESFHPAQALGGARGALG